MGTLYECLREARLERFYPAFRANGITRSEALVSLGPAEFTALGITGVEDSRRLAELVSIIRTVHSQGLNDSPVMQRRHGNSPHGEVQSRTPSGGRDRNNSHVRQYSSSGRDEPITPSQSSNRDSRVPNYSAASYMDMLGLPSDSSEEEEDEDEDEDLEIQEEDITMQGAAAASPVTNVRSSVRASISRTPVERIKHSHEKSYNYGVHKVSSPTKTAKRGRGGIGGRSGGDERIKVKYNSP